MGLASSLLFSSLLLLRFYFLVLTGLNGDWDMRDRGMVREGGGGCGVLCGMKMGRWMGMDGDGEVDACAR